MTHHDLTNLDMVAAQIGGVLLGNGVIGNSSDDRVIERELSSVYHSIVDYAQKESLTGYLELTYMSCVRLIINFSKDAETGEVYISEIGAYDHPWPNKDINYEVLNARLADAIARYR